MQSVHHFDRRRSFVLVLSPNCRDLPATDLAALGAVDWFFVADFDSASSTDGVLAACQKSIESRRSVHILTKGDFISFSPRNATYWYMPRGIDCRIDTLAAGRWFDWHRIYSQDISEKVQELAKKMPRPVTVVAAWYSDEMTQHLNTFLETLLPPLGSGVDVVLASATEVLSQMAEAYGAEVVTIPLHHLLAGLKQYESASHRGLASTYIIPSSSGAPIELARILHESSKS